MINQNICLNTVLLCLPLLVKGLCVWKPTFKIEEIYKTVFGFTSNDEMLQGLQEVNEWGLYFPMFLWHAHSTLYMWEGALDPWEYVGAFRSAFWSCSSPGLLFKILSRI